MLRGGIADERGLRLVEEHTVYRNKVFAGRLYLNRGKRIGSGKRILADLLDRGRDMDAGQLGCRAESQTSDAFKRTRQTEFARSIDKTLQQSVGAKVDEKPVIHFECRITSGHRHANGFFEVSKSTVANLHNRSGNDKILRLYRSHKSLFANAL